MADRILAWSLQPRDKILSPTGRCVVGRIEREGYASDAYVKLALVTPTLRVVHEFMPWDQELSVVRHGR